MQAGTLGNSVNPGLRNVPHRQGDRAALTLAAGGLREVARPAQRPRDRADRTHGAEGVIPLPLWIVLFPSAVIIFVFMLFFADSHERAVVQADDDGRRCDRDHIDVCVLVVSRPSLTIPAQEASGRSRWSEHSASSTKRATVIKASSRFPATSKDLSVAADAPEPLSGAPGSSRSPLSRRAREAFFVFGAARRAEGDGHTDQIERDGRSPIAPNLEALLERHARLEGEVASYIPELASGRDLQSW